MYALVCALGLASTLFYSLGVRRASRAAWAGWGVITALGLYTDYSMLLLVFAQLALFVPLWRSYGSQRSTFWQALLAMLIVLLLFVPQGRLFVTRLVVEGAHGGYYVTLQAMLARWNIALPESQLHAMVLVAGTVALVTTCIAIGVVSRRRIRLSNVYVVAIVLVYLLTLISSAVVRGLLVKRQVLILLPYVLGATVGVVATLGRSQWIAVLLLVTLPFTSYSLMAQEKEAWRDVVCLVERQGEPRDVILFNASYMQIPFDYYYRGPLPCQGVGPASVPKALSNVAASHSRVWLVLSNDSFTDPQGEVLAWFDSHLHLIQAWSYPGIRVRLYGGGAP